MRTSVACSRSWFKLNGRRSSCALDHPCGSAPNVQASWRAYASARSGVSSASKIEITWKHAVEASETTFKKGSNDRQSAFPMLHTINGVICPPEIRSSDSKNDGHQKSS